MRSNLSPVDNYRAWNKWARFMNYQMRINHIHLDLVLLSPHSVAVVAGRAEQVALTKMTSDHQSKETLFQS